MDPSPTMTMVAPLLLRNLITPIFNSADKSLQKYKFLELFRSLLISLFFFLLHLLHFFIPNPPSKHHISNLIPTPTTVTASKDFNNTSAISRSLYQLLSIINDIPVSSRKYGFVRSLAEKIIDDNLKQGSKKLRDVNCNVLSAAFTRTLNQLEAVVLDQDEDNYTVGLIGRGSSASRRILRYFSEQVVYAIGFGGRKNGLVDGESGQDGSWIWAEKWAAELLWLAEKLTACGGVEEAVEKWAEASDLASRVGLFAGSGNRLQGSLVKISAFLMKQDRGITETVEEQKEDGKKQLKAETNLKMLMSWLPLLCRASNGTDAPVLSGSERNELEGLLIETIDKLEVEEQEKVLSLWIHHFSYCPSSDWPNLLSSYNCWCENSRGHMDIGSDS